MKPPLGFYVHSRGESSPNLDVPDVPGPPLPVFGLVNAAEQPLYASDPGIDFLCMGFAFGWLRLRSNQTVVCTGLGCKACAANGGQPPSDFQEHWASVAFPPARAVPV